MDDFVATEAIVDESVADGVDLIGCDRPNLAIERPCLSGLKFSLESSKSLKLTIADIESVNERSNPQTKQTKNQTK